MSRHAVKAATAIDTAATDDAGDLPHAADRHVSTLLDRMLRLLGVTSGRDSTRGFELVPSAETDAVAGGKADNSSREGARNLQQQHGIC